MVNILTSEEFETPEDMARAVIKAAAEALEYRNTYIAVSGALAVGPYATPKAAEKVLPVLQGATGKSAAVALVGSPGHLDGSLEGAEWPGYCECTHNKAMHLVDGNSRSRCAVCERGVCDKFKERKVQKK